MSKRKPPKKKRKNVTRHRRAAADPSVNDRIEDLLLHWDELDRASKGQRLKDLLSSGCSTRGLADSLPISATSIRRYIDTANLPQKAIEAIRSGYSAKKILNHKAQLDRQHRRDDRVKLDEKTGELSDGLADIILAFCKTSDEFPFAKYEEHFLIKFLSEVRNVCWRLESNGFPFPKLLKKHNFKKRLRLTRPPVTSDIPLVHPIEWLAILILAEVPERPIWEAAIVKAAKRAKELKPKDNRSQVKKYLDYKAESLRRIISSPPRRWY